MSAYNQNNRQNFNQTAQQQHTGYQNDSSIGSQDPDSISMGTSSYSSTMSNYYEQGSRPQQPLDEQALNSLLYEQGLVPTYQTDQSLLQQPRAENVSSGATTMMNSMSPSTINDHYSPEPYSQDTTGVNQYSNNTMSQPLGASPFGSPMMASDDGQSSYTTFSYNNTGFSGTNPRLPMQNSAVTANFIQQPGHDASQFMGTQRTPNLSLQVPNFANPFYQQDDTHISTPTNGNSTDPPHLRSPIVRIENYEDQSQAAPNLSRSLSTRSQGSRMSNAHLSPYGNDDFSDDGTLGQASHTGSTTMFPMFGTTDRNEDGSWMTPTGQAGVSPIARAALNTEDIPTLDELAQIRERNDRNSDVKQWIIHSANGSDAEDEGPRRSQYRKAINRPRARSANDIAAMRANQPGVGYLAVPAPPGPGVYLNESSDFGDEDENNSWYASEPDETPVPVNLNAVNEYFGSQISDNMVLEGRPWTDCEAVEEDSTDRHQPMTANAAMIAFRSKAKEADTASLAATIGSRRRSVTDLDNLSLNFSQHSLATAVPEPPHEEKEKKGFFNILQKIPSRNNSRKRRSDASMTNLPPSSPQPARSPQLTPRRSIVGRPRTPKLDTNVPAANGEGRSPGNVVAGISATINRARNSLRHRSKSDLGKHAKSPGLTQLLVQHGGVPVPNLASPARPYGQHLHVQSTVVDFHDDTDDEDDQEGVSMDLTPRMDMLPIPNRDGFKYHILTLNPNIDPQLLDRLTQEQDKRFHRLLDSRKDHDALVMQGKCSKNCPSQGGGPQELPPRTTGRNTDAPAVTFRVIPAGMTEQDMGLGGTENQSVQPAQFPIGIPNPPALSLPSKFECSYCFKAKEFKKPSDWTKHIHEDVQPFTCTFPECSEPKSFKRKADWVRHESERHRQLESWQCDFEECNHICYRRDNFVQHLVREHKVPEPKLRTGRNSGSRSPVPSPIGPDISLPEDYDPHCETKEEYVSRVVERCSTTSDKDPRQEPCRFCGNICTSWKKLNVHLAKHMEQIALPIIPVVERHRIGQHQAHSLATSNSSMMLSSHPMTLNAAASQGMFFDEPGEMTADPSSPIPTIAVGGAPYMGIDLGPHHPGSLLDPTYGTSYPPALMPTGVSRSRASSTSGDVAFGQQQGTTYPPPNMTSFGYGNAPGQQYFQHNGYGG